MTSPAQRERVTITRLDARGPSWSSSFRPPWRESILTVQMASRTERWISLCGAEATSWSTWLYQMFLPSSQACSCEMESALLIWSLLGGMMTAQIVPLATTMPYVYAGSRCGKARRNASMIGLCFERMKLAIAMKSRRICSSKAWPWLSRSSRCFIRRVTSACTAAARWAASPLGGVGSSSRSSPDSVPDPTEVSTSIGVSDSPSVVSPPVGPMVGGEQAVLPEAARPAAGGAQRPSPLAGDSLPGE